MRRALLWPVLVLLTLLQGVGPLLHAHRDGPHATGAIHLHAAVAAPVGDCATEGRALRDLPDALVVALDGIETRDEPAPQAGDAASARVAPPAPLDGLPVAVPPPARALPSSTAWLLPPPHAPPHA